MTESERPPLGWHELCAIRRPLPLETPIMAAEYIFSSERLLWNIENGRETLHPDADYTVADLRRWVTQDRAVSLMLGVKSLRIRVINLLPRPTP